MIDKSYYTGGQQKAECDTVFRFPGLMLCCGMCCATPAMMDCSVVGWCAMLVQLIAALWHGDTACRSLCDSHEQSPSVFSSLRHANSSQIVDHQRQRVLPHP